MRTLLASLGVLLACLAVLAGATQGFQAFTTETARRLEVQQQPRALPAAVLETAQGERLDWSALAGRWLLVDFIYTRCDSYCSVQGNDFARLQDRLAQPIGADAVALLSISFDREHDGPAQLVAYQQRSRSRGPGWIAARPSSDGELQRLLAAFGVTVIPDGLDGYVHNAAINVVDPQGRLVRILDWDAADEAVAYLARQGVP